MHDFPIRVVNSRGFFYGRYRQSLSHFLSHDVAPSNSWIDGGYILGSSHPRIQEIVKVDQYAKQFSKSISWVAAIGVTPAHCMGSMASRKDDSSRL
jgi:hypothetical protein